MKAKKFTDDYSSLLIFSENNLNFAKIIIRSFGRYDSEALFFTQQSIEKSLKGFLSYHSIRYEKTHNLLELLGQCNEIDSYFSSFFRIADMLNPYAVEMRYPHNKPEPSIRFIEECLLAAEKILSYVISQIDTSIFISFKFQKNRNQLR